MNYFLVSLTFFFSNAFLAQDLKSTLYLLEGEIQFSDSRVYLYRDVKFENFPIFDLSAKHEMGLYYVEDSCLLNSTKTYSIIDKGFHFDGYEVYDAYGDNKIGNYSLECSALIQYKIIVTDPDPLMPTEHAVVSQKEEIKITAQEEGKFSFEKRKGVKPKKSQILSLLEKIIANADPACEYKNLNSKELYKLSKKKNDIKPFWSLELDRVYIKVKPIVISDNEEIMDVIEEEPLQYILELKQNSSY